MDYRKYIKSDPNVMRGKSIIADTRITVELILRKLSEGATIADLLQMYPHLEEIQILAALAYASDVMANEEMISYSA